MALLIGVVSQKGGVGKSTLARLIAREYAANDWNVKIADLDVSQGTTVDWQLRRAQNGLKPDIAVESFRTLDAALRTAEHYDLMVFDAPPHSNAATLQIAQACQLTVLPTGLALDDLKPTVRLAHELVKQGIDQGRFAFVLSRVGESEPEISEARAYLKETGYTVLKGELAEKTAYRRASDEGRALTETRFSSLNERAEIVAQAIINQIEKPLRK